MKIYLDAKDLINVLERAIPCTTDQLNQTLRRSGHELVLSFHTIIEISAPLCEATSTSNVMRLLNQLEELPIVFIHAGIDRLELEEAINAFKEERHYGDIRPFLNRFDEAVDLHANPATQAFMNYSLAETVWDLYCHGSLQGLETYAPKMRDLVAADRSLKNPPSLKTNFANMIRKQLHLHNISFLQSSLSAFANWIYEKPSRCPSVRLSYEVWHQIVKNKTDLLEDSDMEDYQHLYCLPYVDLMSLDRRMYSYVSQAVTSLGLDYTRRIFRSAHDLLGAYSGTEN